MATNSKKEGKMIIAYVEDGVSKQREATAEEIAYIESAQADAQAAKAGELAELAKKAQAKAALLERLGITSDEAALLLP
jgi:hypothetical protein